MRSQRVDYQRELERQAQLAVAWRRRRPTLDVERDCTHPLIERSHLVVYPASGAPQIMPKETWHEKRWHEKR